MKKFGRLSAMAAALVAAALALGGQTVISRFATQVPFTPAATAPATTVATALEAAPATAPAAATAPDAADVPDFPAYQPTAWDPDACPEYYRIVGPASVPADAPAPGEVRYGGLDSLGRTTRVEATVTHDMYEAARGHEARFDEDDDPSGWGHNAKATIEAPNGHAYHGYFWNRSHLLADSLGGAAARDNVVTGTRMQNVGANDGEGGMAYEESRVRDWLGAHPDGTVYYAATPAYVGDELVPRSVFVEVRTSDGAIDEQVEVYNAAYGYTIDYADGTFAPTGE